MTVRVRAVLVMALLTGGCSVYTRGLRRDDRPSTSSAILYGRFEMIDNGATNAMGFALACSQGESEETYNLGFSRRTPVQVFEVIHKELSPGIAYYLGDFLSASTIAVKYPGLLKNGRIHETWGLKNISSDYAKTTGEMKRAFPRLASLPTEDASMRD